MKFGETQSVISLALLYAMRMLGLFMMLPVFSILGQSLTGANGFLIGLAIGAYGLSQAVLQVPFGLLSDRYGRKNLLVIGLLIFVAGSVVAAVSESIYGVIAGRFLQGAGAIASVLMALLSDLTREENRTRAMAVIGLSIGISFSVALVLGPLVSSWFGLSGIFWLTACMAASGILIVVFLIPTPVSGVRHRDSQLVKEMMHLALQNPELRRLDFGIFALHLCLTALFIVVPLELVGKFQLNQSGHWWVYLSVTGLSFVTMVPFIILGEKKRKMKPVFLGAIALLFSSSLLLAFLDGSLAEMWAGLFGFFVAFNLLEASLPSLVSKISPAGMKGTAMGFYASSQFLGAFLGGVCGGMIYQLWGGKVVYIFCSVTAGLWFFYALSMKRPGYTSSLMVRLDGDLNQHDALRISGELAGIQGVEDVVVVIEERSAYLKIDRAKIDMDEIRHYSPLVSGKRAVE
ncbi:MAG: MFS transporter [Proteobacteria bacterium]|nr:MAG: MFS transporter [Pseudomonadota bacterium]PIE40029.1 MAG: MFS transporter [Gammaproteobacteria bacterium]